MVWNVSGVANGRWWLVIGEDDGFDKKNVRRRKGAQGRKKVGRH